MDGEESENPQINGYLLFSSFKLPAAGTQLEPHSTGSAAGQTTQPGLHTALLTNRAACAEG